MKKQKPPIDTLAAVAGFAFDRKIALNDPALRRAYIEAETERFERALDDDELIRGQSTENMFKELVCSLGRVKMLKTEDTGPFWGSETLTAPDFRAVFQNGDNCLIEVKHIWCKDPAVQRKTFTKPYAEKLFAYADATKTELRMAIYWSRWRLWSLIDPRKFRKQNGVLDIEMTATMLANELERLGDLYVGALMPLRFLVEFDKSQPKSISDEGEIEATIASAKVYSGGREITDSPGINLVFTLMMYGGLEADDPQPIMENGEIVGIELIAKPEEPPEQSDHLHLMGPISRIFSTYFLDETRNEGAITQLTAPPKPSWFESLPTWHAKGATQKSDMPLWLFRQRPFSEPDTD